MIEFFQFMNSCSPFRTVTYLVFILILLYMAISTIGGLTEMILYRDSTDKVVEDKSKNDGED